jgi:hypothetical protein
MPLVCMCLGIAHVAVDVPDQKVNALLWQPVHDSDQTCYLCQMCSQESGHTRNVLLQLLRPKAQRPDVTRPAPQLLEGPQCSRTPVSYCLRGVQVASTEGRQGV